MVTQEILEEVKKRLVQTYDPLEIYLFGSYAWGVPDEESDLDLLVVVDESTDKRHLRGIPGLEALWGMMLSKDLMVFTKNEFERYALDKTTLCHKVKTQGRILYERS